MKVAPCLWIPALLIACAELLALSVLCQSQMEVAQARREATLVRDAVFGYCLDQLNAFTISRCRKRFGSAP